MNMLKIALRKIKSEGSSKDDDSKKKKGNSALEQAMADFQDAATPAERAAAFKAALALADDND